MRIVRGLLLLALAWVGTSPPDVEGQSMSRDSTMSVAKALVEAFNRLDADAMASLVTDDFELYYMDENGLPTLAVRGRDGLRQEMLGYFAARPSVRSELTGTIGGSRFVAFREQIVGGASSIAVYEIRSGLVRRSWYYPAEPAGGDGA